MSDAVGTAVVAAKPKREMRLQVVRSLTLADLPALRNRPKGMWKSPPLEKLSHTHHVIAQMLAKGDKKQWQIAQEVGISSVRIGVLKREPIFKAVLEEYKAKQEFIFIDVLERQRNIELQVLEEILRRLESEPAEWKKGELLALADQLARARGAGSGGGAGSGSVNVSVKFVQAPAAEGPKDRGIEDAVDVKFEDVA